MLLFYLAGLLGANLALLLPPASPVRLAGTFLLLGFLPGLTWAGYGLSRTRPLLRWLVAIALSYIFTSLVTLLLHYLPGPLEMWQLVACLDVVAIVPLLLKKGRLEGWRTGGLEGWKVGRLGKTLIPSNLQSPTLILIIVIVIVSIFLRTANLEYSEFQGDEALAMITAAEAATGHQDALFLRSKGPGEVLLPLALWRLAGTVTEPAARLPFTLATLLATVTVYLIGEKLAGRRVGLWAAGFFAFNGFMVAFGRIVQYQALVVWFSALAFLLALEWRASGQSRFAFLAGLCLGTGLLAHYDAILVLPALAWLFVTATAGHGPPTAAGLGYSLPGRLRSAVGRRVVGGLFLLAGLLLAALPFYLPYVLDPQANRTGDYVGGRIGNELRNNLPDFFHFNTFYSSSYYLIITGLLVLGLLAWYAWRAAGRRGWLPALLVAGCLAVIGWPELLAGDNLDLAGLPFALLLAGAFLAFPLRAPDEAGPTQQALIAWLAVPFLGYNFLVALGLTHIYTTVPAWALLAALGWERIPWRAQVSESASQRIPWRAQVSEWRIRLFQPPTSRFGSVQPSNLPSFQSSILPPLLLLLSTFFLWNAFVRHDVEYWQDYPAGNLPLYWSPYDEPPRAGFFGFAHRAGWKAVGTLITRGELAGDYGSNEEPDVTTWYTRGAPRACDPQPEFYFLADDLIDPIAVPGDGIASAYNPVGLVTLPNQKRLKIMQLQPVTLSLGDLVEAGLSRDFDETATPAAFARSARGAQAVEANFAHLVRLIGYDVNTRRAYPGGRVPVTLYWQALAAVPASYQVFTHLESETGPVAQSDGVPVCWTYPTDLWRPGQIIADQHAIQLSPTITPGAYPLQVGLYLPDTWQRLDVLDEAGNPAGTSVTLASVEVGQGGATGNKE